MRKISIFGVTGSIGQSTYDLICRAGGADAFHVVALSGGKNIELLAEMAHVLRPEVVVCSDAGDLEELGAALANTTTMVAAGADALKEAAQRPADWIMNGVIGAAGLVPSLEAARQGTVLALANKESLVTAGPLLMKEAHTNNATILPVDSEHSAIFQALNGEKLQSVEKIILTASGGALREWPSESLSYAKVDDCLKHPNWSMGKRITIDSASMFNKAMEVIEAYELFNLKSEQIEVIIHPESIIHSLVAFNDGALMAHMGMPDMRHSIGYALNWPDRQTLPVKRLNLAQLGKLHFYEPDLDRFPALRICRNVMKMGGLAGAAFNAAKETALDRFLDGGLIFTQMAQVVETVLERLYLEGELNCMNITLENILEADTMTRNKTQSIINDLCANN